MGRSIGSSLHRAPASRALVLALTVTTLTLVGDPARPADAVLNHASTNLANLSSHPFKALLISPFWLDTGWLLLPLLVVVALVMAPVERALGTARTVAVFAAGHIGATLLTVTGIAAGIGQGWLPVGLARALDVGPSYGLAALAGVLVHAVRPPRRRWLVAVALLGGFTVPTVLGGDFTDVGHLLAAGIGVGLAAVQTRSSVVGPEGPSAAQRMCAHRVICQ